MAPAYWWRLPRFSDDGEGTLMRYEAQAEVGGKLAQLGGRLIDSAAKKLADQFFEKFAAVVGDPHRPEGRRGDPDDERAFIRAELTRLSSRVAGEVLVVSARQGRRSPGPDRC
jgi:hypothetical protein